MDAVQILGRHPEGRIGLGVDTLHPASLNEVPDVLAPEGGGQVALYGADRNAEGARLLPIDIDLVLGHVGHAVRTDPGQAVILVGHAQQLVLDLRQLLVAEVAPVLKHEIEARGVAQFRHRRRREGEDHGALDACEVPHGLACNILGAQARLLAQIPVLQLHEHHGLVLAAACEAHARAAHDGLHGLLLVLPEVPLHLLDDGLGLFQGAAHGQLDHGHEAALVLIRQVARGHAEIQQAHGRQEGQEDRAETGPAPQDEAHVLHVEIPGPKELVIEPQEEGPQQFESRFSGFVPLGHRLEQRGAQHRRKHQGHHHGKHHGGDDRHRELAVDHARGTREEDHGTEHGGQGETDADEGALDLIHGSAGGLPGRQALVGHHPLHVLHHHDGAIHQQTDGQHHGEHGEHVDGVAEGRQHAEGAQDHHGHRDGGDQRGPQVPHEEVHHQEHQHDRFQEGLHHFVDGHLHEGRGVVGVDHLHAFREVLAQLGHLVLHRLGGLQRVGAGLLADGDAARGLAVVEELHVGRFGAQLRAADVLHAHHRAIGRGPQRDVGELFRRHQHRLHDDGGVEALARHRRAAADLARGDLHVVGPHRGHHVI
ncbi:MAG: hypothetical protein BWY56_01302 [Acidobacteria bacterium ADurb.Bin340]|nr:MAG: hypothetical protein BWY56_01302 [Acidobacteria bacterium ADurb.Bin340]